MVFGVQEVLIIQESYMIWQKKKRFVYILYFVSSVVVCNLSMNLIGEISV